MDILEEPPAKLSRATTVKKALSIVRKRIKRDRCSDDPNSSEILDKISHHDHTLDECCPLNDDQTDVSVFLKYCICNHIVKILCKNPGKLHFFCLSKCTPLLFVQVNVNYQ